MEPAPPVLGAGSLSAQARARLARPAGPPLRPPPIDDLSAVGRWRIEVHRAWLEGDPPVESCGHREASLDRVRVLRTAPVADRPRILYLHGGGYALGSPEVAVPITERLAPGAEVVSVDYRLAPEHPFPAGLDDAAAAFRALAAERPDTAIVVAGDSAGANLALSLALSLVREQGSAAAGNRLAIPAGLILFSPHVEVSEPDRDPDSDRGRDRPTDLDDDGARWLVDAYRGPLPREHPGLSPGRADLRGLPPILIQVGTIDTSFDHGVRLARRARSAGVEVTLDVWHGLWHTWQYHRDLPEADQALSEAAAFATACADRRR